MLILFFISFRISAVIINPGTYFSVGNEDYTVNQSMNFESVTVASSYIVFNDTGFYLSSGNDITVTLVYISDDFVGAVDGELVLAFYADTVGGVVWFNLSGFPPGFNYTVKRSGSVISSPSADGFGFISFSNIAWSSYLFKVFQDGDGSLDSSSPVVSNIGNISSVPLDSDSSLGWVNVSCDVTDDVAVDEVSLNITNPDGSDNVISMNPGDSSNYDCNSSTVFSTHGNYSYYVWACDTTGNSVVSSSFDFSMPPNWDVNVDGFCSVFDYVLVSNHYSESGDAGWIREDVDNNGAIQVLDFVLLSNSYGEVWWV